jgi:hypothetical protein
LDGALDRFPNAPIPWTAFQITGWPPKYHPSARIPWMAFNVAIRAPIFLGRRSGSSSKAPSSFDGDADRFSSAHLSSPAIGEAKKGVGKAQTGAGKLKRRPGR